MTPPDALYLDDLKAGDEFRSAEHQLDVDQITTFARDFDPQPFHLDPQAAKNTFFQGLAASGWHTAAITMKLLVGSLPLGSGIIGTGGEASWPRPVRPGDTLRVISTVREVTPSRSRPDRGIVTVECRTVNQAGDICQRLVTKLVVMRRPEPPTAK